MKVNLINYLKGNEDILRKCDLTSLYEDETIGLKDDQTILKLERIELNPNWIWVGPSNKGTEFGLFLYHIEKEIVYVAVNNLLCQYGLKYAFRKTKLNNIKLLNAEKLEKEREQWFKEHEEKFTERHYDELLTAAKHEKSPYFEVNEDSTTREAIHCFYGLRKVPEPLYKFSDGGVFELRNLMLGKSQQYVDILSKKENYIQRVIKTEETNIGRDVFSLKQFYKEHKIQNAYRENLKMYEDNFEACLIREITSVRATLKGGEALDCMMTNGAKTKAYNAQEWSICFLEKNSKGAFMSYKGIQQLHFKKKLVFDMEEFKKKFYGEKIHKFEPIIEVVTSNTINRDGGSLLKLADQFLLGKKKLAEGQLALNI